MRSADTALRVGRAARLSLPIALPLLAVAVLVRIWDLTAQSLWYDEAYSLFFSTPPDGVVGTVRRMFAIGGSDKFQPLYHVVLEFWRELFGSSEAALRSLSVVLGSVTVGVVYGTALRWYGKRHAIWSLALAAVSAVAVLYSQEVRPYALILAVGSLQVAAFLEVSATDGPPTRRATVVFWLVTAVAYLTSVMLGLFAAAMFLAQALVARRRSMVLTWLPVIMIGGVISVVYVLGYVLQPQGDFSALRGSIVKNIAYVPFGLLAGTTYGPPAEGLRGDDQLSVMLGYWPELLAFGVVMLGLTGGAALGFLRAARGVGHDSRVDRLLLVTLVVAFGLTVAFVVASRLNWQPRHSLFLLPLLWLLLPVAGRRTRALGTWGRSLRVVGTLALVGLLAINSLALIRYLTDPAYARDDYRSTAAILQRERGEDGASVLLWGRIDLLQYYGDTLTLDGTDLEKDGLSEGIQRLTGDSSRVVVAINRDFYWDPEGLIALERAMGPDYRLDEVERVPYFLIATFVSR